VSGGFPTGHRMFIDTHRQKITKRAGQGGPDPSRSALSLELQPPEQLRARIRLLEAVIDNFPGGLLLFDQNLKLVLCNEQQQALLEYPQTLFSNGEPSLEEIFRVNAKRGEYGPGPVEAHVSAKMALVAQKCAHVFERTRPNGTVLEIRGVPLPAGGFVTTYLDVTDQRKNQRMIEHMALHDAVTGLPNRAKLSIEINRALKGIADGRNFALHYIDLDRFKPINDQFGHEAGDAILKSVASRLQECVRESDMAARIGGDEFIVLQMGVRSAHDAEMVASRVIKAVSRSHVLRDQTHRVGVSVGIAVAPWDSRNSEELIRKADKAMYRSKNAGGNQFCFYS
jgi:diguanylate cyclase (GGDEF)-like protein